jgi:hypothetical protein
MAASWIHQIELSKLFFKAGFSGVGPKSFPKVWFGQVSCPKNILLPKEYFFRPKSQKLGKTVLG